PKWNGSPIYVYHEIVHNRHVVEDLRSRGAIFIEDIDAVPTGSVCIFSAHGVASLVVQQADQRGLQAIDATCPLVTKVHAQAQRYHRKGYELIIIGHAGHPEVEGTRGRVEGDVYVMCTVEEVNAFIPKDPDKLAYVTQTTLSVDDTRDVIEALKSKFPNIQGPDLQDICYATQNRQNAARELSEKADLLLVVGAQNSSNSNRLREVGEQSGIPSYLIADAGDIQPEWVNGIKKIGVTAGASAPETLVQGVIEYLKTLGVEDVSTMSGIEENTTFRIPVTLLREQKRQQAKQANDPA
ncbi:MAG: 4-hydroxy-3-methylbut-2-enyl diphosphate reductase, partial [Pseudomonadota bacterium]